GQVLSSIQVSPGTVGLVLNSAQTFSATGYDQFGAALASQPAFSWAVISGVGSINAAGQFSSSSGGAATVRASSGGVGGNASITVTNAAPTVASAASFSGKTNTTVNLSALGSDDGGEGGLSYTWSMTSGPAGAAPSFSSNGFNSSKNTTVTFNRA